MRTDNSDFIMLSFAGKKLDPNRITKITGIEPNAKAKKDGFSGGLDYASGRFPKRRIKSKTGYWIISPQSKQKIEDQFVALTKKFKRRCDILAKVMTLDSIEEAYIEVVIRPSRKYATYSCRLRAKDLEFWSSMGIDVIYSCSLLNFM
jgi:hypothetical protein